MTKKPFPLKAKVVVVETKHAHIPKGSIGFVNEILPKDHGYAIEFKKSIHVNPSGGGSVEKPSIAFFHWKSVKLTP